VELKLIKYFFNLVLVKVIVLVQAHYNNSYFVSKFHLVYDYVGSIGGMLDLLCG
jgi:hypothetical protein